MTNDRSEAVVFQPPDGERVPGLVDEMCVTVKRSGWHPSLEAAWIHVATAAIHPFCDGNGRTARVMASLAMYRGGFRHPAFTSLEEWWGKHPTSYYEAFACLGRSSREEADVTAFLMTHVRAQLSQVLSLALRQRTDGRLWTTLENLLDDARLPARLANALYDSFFNRDITTGYYADLIDASVGTARNDLTAAAAAGFLRSEGRTRARRFVQGPELMSRVAGQLAGVAPTTEAILEELVRRSADSMDWSELHQEPPPLQQELPGWAP